MRDAFAMFAPYKRRAQGHDLRVGPHRPEDPLYEQARDDRRTSSPSAGWMVVTGAGPGIMEAGMEGAGREQLDRRVDPAAVRDTAPTR